MREVNGKGFLIGHAKSLRVIAAVDLDCLGDLGNEDDVFQEL